jgi:hypothetical protein
MTTIAADVGGATREETRMTPLDEDVVAEATQTTQGTWTFEDKTAQEWATRAQRRQEEANEAFLISHRLAVIKAHGA